MTAPVALFKLFFTPVPALTEMLPSAVTLASASCPAETVAPPAVLNVPWTFCSAETERLPPDESVASMFCIAKALSTEPPEPPAEAVVPVRMFCSETNEIPAPAPKAPCNEPKADAVTEPSELVAVAFDIAPPEYSETLSGAVADTVVSEANDEIDAVMGSSLVPPPAATVALLIAPAAHKLALKPALTLTFEADA